MRLIWGREPAVFWAMVATLLQALLLLVPNVNATVHGAANAAILAAAGFLTAAWVAVDAMLPALTGLIKAIFALVLALGMNIPESTQVGILAVVAAVFAFLERQNVTAKVRPTQGV